MMNVSNYIFVQTIDHTTPTVNYRLCVSMKCQCVCIILNKYTTLMSVLNGRDYACVGAGGNRVYRKYLYFSLNFAVNQKLLFKVIVNKITHAQGYLFSDA